MSALSALRAAVVGGGPAGLMAAQVLAEGGAQVDLFERMPSVGRKFLLAGKGGLNLTHGEDLDRFIARFGQRSAQLAPLLRAWPPQALRDWAAALGIETFIGSSGRVFPTDMKAAPLLRAWLHRLRAQGVRLHMRHRWLGAAADLSTLGFATPQGEVQAAADVLVLALGGGSWPRLGSDGGWVDALRAMGAEVAALQPSNCGFECRHAGRPGWSAHFTGRHAGHALKSVALEFDAAQGGPWRRTGEFVISDYGIEGSLVYAASSRLREAIQRQGQVIVQLDLLPARDAQWVAAELARPRGPRSLSTHLKSRLGLHGVKLGLLHELVPKDALSDAPTLARHIKALPLQLLAPRPLAEAISSAGGVRFEALDERLMLRARPGVFCAGEMLDWEAPTGGYLLSACFATGRAAGSGALDWWAGQRR